MLELQLDPNSVKTIGDNQYYLFPSPPTHTNQKDRPTAYADEKLLKTYTGKGSNGSALLHPDALTPANTLMSALLEYGDKIKDWSIQSAVIQNGYRPDDESQGRNYLRIINLTIAQNAKIFGTVKFPDSLNAEAQGVLGNYGDYSDKGLTVSPEAFKERAADTDTIVNQGEVLFRSDEAKANYLDERMNEVYKAVRVLISPPRFAKTKQEQIAWLKKRDAANATAEKCLLIEERIKALQELAQ